jgi:hypothetical protein
LTPKTRRRLWGVWGPAWSAGRPPVGHIQEPESYGNGLRRNAGNFSAENMDDSDDSTDGGGEFEANAVGEVTDSTENVDYGDSQSPEGIRPGCASDSGESASEGSDEGAKNADDGNWEMEWSGIVSPRRNDKSEGS